jgi:hypothetical protein
MVLPLNGADNCKNALIVQLLTIIYRTFANEQTGLSLRFLTKRKVRAVQSAVLPNGKGFTVKGEIQLVPQKIGSLDAFVRVIVKR